MATKMICGASSSSSSRRNYDVFLSFYGKDTRKNFTDHLYTALVQNGIHTFRDDEELEKGEDISSELMDAIEDSKIAIIIFSENYASSPWCLNELVKILDCRKKGQTVIPFFYKVDPSTVRHKKRSFAEAFERHEKHFEETGKVETWKAALTEAANLSGWDQLHVTDGYESKIIKKIVEEVLTRVNQTPLDIAACPVGLDPHIERISCLLNDRLDVVRIVGIHGLGGIGKTTIAKAVFNVMFQKFEGSSFLANVREVSSQQNGLALLQAQLLFDVLKGIKIDIRNEDKGIMIIKNSLSNKKVLIVLDDVDNSKQFDKLVREHGWFGLGSRIIITTRDEHLLNRPEVDEKYAVKPMDTKESLQLFSYHAFRENHPLQDYVRLSYDVVHYASGLPLALVILGSLLLDKKSQAEWKSELEKLRKMPNGEILEILQISYDALDDFSRTIFLDIACFLVREKQNEAIQFFDGCGLCPTAGIRLLIQMSLLTIDKFDRFHMHDLIQDMGKEIVRKQSPQNLGGRSRLWSADALDVLENLTGTSAIECLRLDLLSLKRKEKVQLNTKAFFYMPNLRFLQIIFYCRINPIEWKKSHNNRIFLFRNLRCLEWENFPFKCIPNNFDLRNLIVLKLPCNKNIQVWKGTKILLNLKILNLTCSSNLICTPDFSGLPNLEKLLLGYCQRLVKIHESIDHLSKLVYLSLGYCNSLRNLPSGISKLASLESFDIGYCNNIEKLPVGIESLTRLRSLDVAGTAIEELPSSLILLKNLSTFEYFVHRGQRNPKSIALLSASMYGWYSLNHLQLANCHLMDVDIPDDLWKLCCLKSLDLSSNNFCSLPSSICDQLPKLEILQLNYCKSFQSLPRLSSSLCILEAMDCKSLERLPNLSNLKHLKKLKLTGCSKLNEIEALGSLESGEEIDLYYCDNLDKNRILQEISKEFRNRNVYQIRLIGNEIPEWFEFQNESSSASCEFAIPHNMEIRGVIICIVLPSSKAHFNEVVVHNQSKNSTWKCMFFEDGLYRAVGDRLSVMKIPYYVWKSIAGFGDVINVSVRRNWDGVIVRKKIGVHLF